MKGTRPAGEAAWETLPLLKSRRPDENYGGVNQTVAKCGFIEKPKEGFQVFVGIGSIGPRRLQRSHMRRTEQDLPQALELSRCVRGLHRALTLSDNLFGRSLSFFVRDRGFLFSEGLGEVPRNRLFGHVGTTDPRRRIVHQFD